MTSKDDAAARPTPRKRSPQPAPDAGQDPMDTAVAATPAPAAAPAPVAAAPAPVQTSAPRSTGRRQDRLKVQVKSSETDTRAVVQLGVRVSTEVDKHLEKIVAETGRTRRELVEMAIMALEVSS